MGDHGHLILRGSPLNREVTALGEGGGGDGGLVGLDEFFQALELSLN